MKKSLYSIAISLSLCSMVLTNCVDNKTKGDSSQKELTTQIPLKVDSIPFDFAFNPERWNLQDNMLWVINSRQDPFLIGFDIQDHKKRFEGGHLGQGPEDFISPGIVEGSTPGPLIYSNTLNKFDLFVFEQDTLRLVSKGKLPLAMNNGTMPNPYTRIAKIDDNTYAGTYFFPRFVGVDIFDSTDGKLLGELPLSVEMTEETKSRPYELKVSADYPYIAAAYRYMDFLEVFKFDDKGEISLLTTVGDCSSPQNELYEQERDDEMIYYYSDVVCREGKVFLLYQGVPEGKLSEANTELHVYSLKDGKNLANASLDRYFDQMQVSEDGTKVYLHSPENEDYLFEAKLPK